MDQNNNTNTNPINNNQDLEFKKLLDQYSNEVDKTLQSEEPLPSNFEPQSQPEPPPEMIPNQEPSLASGFDSQIPQKSEEPLTPNFESQPQTEQPPEMIPNQELINNNEQEIEQSLDSGFDSQIPQKSEEFVAPPENQFSKDYSINEPALETNIPYQPVGQKFNFFKFLFIISLLIFLGVLVSIVYAFINSQQTEGVIETSNISVIPTATIIPEVTIVPTIFNPVPMVEEIIVPTASPTAILTAAPTPILKTYRNTNYKFSFQYPTTWTVREVLPTGDQLKTDNLYVNIFEPKETRKKDDYGNDLAILSINLVDLKKINMTFDEYISDQIAGNLITNVSDAKVSTYDAKHNTTTGMLNYDSYLLLNGNIIFDFISRYGSSNQPPMIVNGPAKIILDTFKLN